MKSYILVIDSGIGGVSVLNALLKKFPQENFLYIADNLHAPFGERTKKDLTQIIIELIKHTLKKFKIKLIIFACNTITATVIDEARKTFSIDFVGTEPNIKGLYDSGQNGIVLATTATIKNCKILNKYKTRKIKLVALKKVAKLLDENFCCREKVKIELKKQLKKYVGVTNVVLGCTHYNFLKKEISEILQNNDIHFFSSVSGIVNRVETIIEDNSSQLNGEVIVLTTKKDENFLNNLNKALEKIET